MSNPIFRFCLSFYLLSHNSQIDSQLESLNTGKSLRCKTKGTLSLRVFLATKTITFESLTTSPEQNLLSFLLYAASKLILANGLFGAFQLSFPSRLADSTLTTRNINGWSTYGERMQPFKIGIKNH
ncbi:uncharacterized protein [Gossypium hirsutum]|uniref:Uncharacterized protein isoform X4 n=1 Tax=Gossypium hirsutum TaxID=3635 RepID=A0A1U8NGN0_GOSHI|nr:uncharacterized protein LOC107948244 isoform X4 [Gossypium hirsutum]